MIMIIGIVISVILLIILLFMYCAIIVSGKADYK